MASLTSSVPRGSERVNRFCPNATKRNAKTKIADSMYGTLRCCARGALAPASSPAWGWDSSWSVLFMRWGYGDPTFARESELAKQDRERVRLWWKGDD